MDVNKKPQNHTSMMKFFDTKKNKFGLYVALLTTVFCVPFSSVSQTLPKTDYNPPTFDLDTLPIYEPETQISGVLRITGTPLDSLIGKWAGRFKEHHKRVRFTTYLINTSQAIAGLVEETADIGVMGHSAWLTGLQAFEEAFGYPPTEIRIANGSYDDPKGSTPGLVFFVHKDNPLDKISLKQIDGIFGTARTGGWKGTQWSSDSARGNTGNIRTWGQLGLRGDWQERVITPRGTDVTLSNWAHMIESVAFQGSAKWNPALVEGPRADTVRGNRDAEIVQRVASDPSAIGFMFKRVINAQNLDVKILPIEVEEGKPAVFPSNKSFHEGTYPFRNSVYIYVNKHPGMPLPERENEFIRFILSQDGQRIIADDRRFIPLNSNEIMEELKKLD